MNGFHFWLTDTDNSSRNNAAAEIRPECVRTRRFQAVPYQKFPRLLFVGFLHIKFGLLIPTAKIRRNLVRLEKQTLRFCVLDYMLVCDPDKHRKVESLLP